MSAFKEIPRIENRLLSIVTALQAPRANLNLSLDSQAITSREQRYLCGGEAGLSLSKDPMSSRPCSTGAGESGVNQALLLYAHSYKAKETAFFQILFFLIWIKILYYSLANF